MAKFFEGKREQDRKISKKGIMIIRMYEETGRQGVQGVQDVCLSTPNPQKT